MRKFIFLIAVLLPIQFFGQNINNLDVRNGFKDFKLGDNYSKWSSQLAYSRTKSDGVKIYEYTGTCCSMLFDYNLAKIELGFLNSSLIIIYLETENFQKPYSESNQFTNWRKDDFERINNSFEVLFGKPSGIDAEEDITYHWQSKQVLLRSTYKYLGVREGDKQIVFVMKLDYLQDKTKSGF